MTAIDPGQKDRIQILLSEYSTLRSEILNRTGYGFQIGAVSAAVITWLLQQQIGHWSWHAWAGLIFIVGAAITFAGLNVRDVTRVAARVRELEHEINSRAGEHLLVWETLSGSARKGYLAAILGARQSARSELPPLDGSYSDPRPQYPKGDSTILS